MASDDELLEDYLAQVLDLRDTGQHCDLHALCSEHPHLEAALASALELVEHLPGLHAGSKESDRFLGKVLKQRYRLIERIGSGAMGAVYRARDEELSRDVAVKMLQCDWVGGDRAERRFLREAESLAAIEHDHIVPVHDRGRDDGSDGCLFLVMGLIAGPSLATVLQWAASPDDAPQQQQGLDWLRERLPSAELESSYLRQCVRWAAEVGSALSEAHRHGIVHRDVKPSNVLITSSGRAVLADFGIAARAADGTMTSAGSSVGTPWYMAPEVAAGIVTDPDPAADIYSVGATLYHLIARRPPFEDEPLRVLARVQQEDPPRLATLFPGLSRDLQAIVEHAMERRPRARYPTSSALEADLRAFLDHGAVSVRPRGVLRRSLRAVQRRPIRVSAAILLLAFGIVVSVWQEREAARAVVEHARRVRVLPALLAIEGFPQQRLLVGDHERSAVLQELDELLALRPDDVATRVVRLAVRQDCGEHDAAYADAVRIADGDGSQYVREWAERFASADPDQRGLGAIDFQGLPDPVTDAGKFLAAFLALRTREPEGSVRAAELLGQIRHYAPARDLRLIALLATGELDEAYEDALRLEGVYGAPTARTRHVIGAVLLSRRDYEGARVACEDAVRLRPGRHGSMQNLGIALDGLGFADLAQEWFLAAYAVRPWLWNTALRLSRVHRDRCEFDQAIAWASKIPESGPRGEAWIRAVTLARVHYHRVISVWEDDSTLAAARAAATDGLACYDLALRSGIAGRQRASAEQEADALRGVFEGVCPESAERFMRHALERPLHGPTIRQLAIELPGDALSAEQVQGVKELLRLQADALVTPPTEFLRPQDLVPDLGSESTAAESSSSAAAGAPTPAAATFPPPNDSR